MENIAFLDYDYYHYDVFEKFDLDTRWLTDLGKPSSKKSPELSGIFPTLVKPPPGFRENQMISYLSFWQP